MEFLSKEIVLVSQRRKTGKDIPNRFATPEKFVLTFAACPQRAIPLFHYPESE